jgi:hypothetical protein
MVGVCIAWCCGGIAYVGVSWDTGVRIIGWDGSIIYLAFEIESNCHAFDAGIFS